MYIRHGWILLLLSLVATAGGAAPLTIYLAGDSTMADKVAERRPETGWGEELPKFFDANAVQIENHARNGRSTRTFIEEGLWQKLIDRVQPGDNPWR